MDKDDRIDQLIKEHKQEMEVRIENEHFLTIALNLSGKKDKLLNDAHQLIHEYGLLKALKLSRKKQIPEDFTPLITGVRIKLLEEVDNIPVGSVILVSDETDTCYYGVWSSMVGSYPVCVRKDKCKKLSKKEK